MSSSTPSGSPDGSARAEAGGVETPVAVDRAEAPAADAGVSVEVAERGPVRNRASGEPEGDTPGSDAPHPEAGEADVPSMLDLIRLSPRLLFPPGGRQLYRQIALLADLSEEDEVIVVGCGNGVSLEYFVTEFGAHGCGVDVHRALISDAEERARGRGLASDLQFQHAPMDRLPYRDDVFDVAVGELGMTHDSDPAHAVAELARVTRPGGTIVLVQPVWKAPVDEERRRVLTDHLGVHPLMLVEWKRILRENGVEALHTEDWSDEETAFRPRVAKPFPDFAELFTLPEKIGILRRAWRRWGFAGVWTAILREREMHRLLSRERILGLDLVKGTLPEREEADQKSESEAPADAQEPVEPEAPDPADAAGDVSEAAPGGTAASREEAPRETSGLPLFSPEDENA